MRKYQNDCCGCDSPAYPCNDCNRRHALHVFCDICGADLDLDDVYEDNGKELCEDCLKEAHKINVNS